MRSLIVTVALGLAAASPAFAASDTIEVTLQDHKFEPSEIHVTANEPFMLHVTNKDATPDEFDSHALGVEKVIAGGSDGIIRINALPAGEYPFMGEFHAKTAKGSIVAE